MKKKVLVFTGNRAEYGLQLPVIKALNKSKKIDCLLIVSGSHLDRKFGETISQIEKDNLKIAEKIKLKNNYNSSLQTPNLIGQAVIKISKSIYKYKPDIFLVNADRFETFAATIASTQLSIPTFHIEGGDTTEGGALDDSVRHAITKLSHIHFATNELSYRNIINLGEEKWRTFNVGLPVNDIIYNKKFAKFDVLQKKFQISKNKPLLILTQHPVTTEPNEAKNQIKIILSSIKYFIEKYECNVVATYPNNDFGNEDIILELEKFKRKNRNFYLFKSLGNYFYHSLMNLRKNMNVVLVGNSSSGIKEAIAFKCPTLNIGSRQDGRLKPKNVIDVGYDCTMIKKKLEMILFNKDFKKKLLKFRNPYFKKNTGEKITKIIESIKMDKKLLKKKLLFGKRNGF
jgi:UDP-hydrolysing UDP-N-acetyl-D-glucosamine 2-epimerase